MLIDPSHRKINYLRVSLTTRCNFRCLYCYGGPDASPFPDPTLPDEHLHKLLKAFARLGVGKIRFTGGEPLTRPNIVEIVRATTGIEGISRRAVTTNGFMLKRLLPGLIDAGLNGLNISLDSLSREKFRQITGVDGFNRVRAGIKEALDCGAFPLVKINMVVIRGINDDEIPDFARWAQSEPVDIRFIEFMPTDTSGWGINRLIPEAEIRKLTNLPLIPIPRDDTFSGPAKSYSIVDGVGRLSFISAVSHNFCGNCNRLRITSEGSLVGCLFGKSRVSLREILADDPSEEELITTIKSILSSPGFRRKSSACSVSSEQPSMRRIGG